MKLTTPPLAPKTITALENLGICTFADVQVANPCELFLLLKQSGLSVTQSVFWQLVALHENQNLHELDRDNWRKKLANTPPVAIFPPRNTRQKFMRMALAQAQLAAQCGEIPVGAVVVQQGEIVSAAHNRCVGDCDVSHHAEILALAAAGAVLGNYRLGKCDVYVSLEPCAMCASALLQARVRRVIFAAHEAKTGAAGSVINLFENKQLNSHTAILGGVLADEAKAILQAFFQSRRK